MRRNAALSAMLIIFIVMMFALLFLMQEKEVDEKFKQNTYTSLEDDGTDMNLKIISSQENKDLESIITKFIKLTGANIEIEYAGTLEIMDRLNQGEVFDAVWMSNSIWLYMLDDSIKITDSVSTSINPIVFAIKESKARELNLVGREIYTADIINNIINGQLKFSMSNPTQTNSGATAYLGLLSTIAGNPEVLKEEHINDQYVRDVLKVLFNGLERSSGSEEYLESMFLNSEYDAVVTYESSIINMNTELEKTGSEILYALYPVDGVSIADSPLAFINTGENEARKEIFLALQDYIVSKEGQKLLEEAGRRTWYGGISYTANTNVFNPNWGIDTTKYIVPIKFPHTDIIEKALDLYQTELRKPIYTIFALDYSGSMSSLGYEQLCNAMQYILTPEKASKDLLQYTSKDKISVIPFSTSVIDVWNAADGSQTRELLYNILNLKPSGSTNIYDTGIRALQQIVDEDFNTYNVSVILMTDGLSNMGSYEQFEDAYTTRNADIPFYSIMFGDAFEDELQDIADLTNAKVFDGRSSLLEAFKEVRGYN